jgi:hypothetical protein
MDLGSPGVTRPVSGAGAPGLPMCSLAGDGPLLPEARNGQSGSRKNCTAHCHFTVTGIIRRELQ